MSRREALACLAFVGGFALFLASAITAPNNTEWHKLPGGDCQVREHHDRRWLWLDDTTTRAIWCRQGAER